MGRCTGSTVFVANSAPESLGWGRWADASIAAGPRCRLVGPLLRGARPNERAGRAGPAAGVNRGRQTRLAGPGSASS
jgi:hypothetical protein